MTCAGDVQQATHTYSAFPSYFSVSLCGTQWPIFSTLPMTRNLLWMVDWLTCKRFAKTRVDWVVSSSKSSCRATSLVSCCVPECALPFRSKSSSLNFLNHFPMVEILTTFFPYAWHITLLINNLINSDKQIKGFIEIYAYKLILRIYVST